MKLLLVLLINFIPQSNTEIRNHDLLAFTKIQSALKVSQGRVTTELRNAYPIYSLRGEEYISLVVKTGPNYRKEDLEDLGIIVGARVGDIVSLKYPLTQLNTIKQVPGIKRLQLATKIAPDLNRVLVDIRADQAHQGLNMPQPYTGKDVLIGVTDWGFDYTSPMFYDIDLEETRILAAWDQFANNGGNADPAFYPEGFTYGAEYDTPEELMAVQSDTSNFYSYSTHGTHVAGIAGGSGAGTDYKGVAYDAQFLFTTFLADEGAVLDAWEWMYQKSLAEDKRLIVNMSWGLYWTGELDGTSLISQAIDNYSLLGVVFVTSAGNNGDVNFHIKKDFANDTLYSRIEFGSSTNVPEWVGQEVIAWSVEEDAPMRAGFDIYSSSDNSLLYEGDWWHSENFAYTSSSVDFDGGSFFYEVSFTDNGKHSMNFVAQRPEGPFYVVLKATSEQSSTYHFWNVAYRADRVGNWGMRFLGSADQGFTAGDNSYGIGAPACTNSAIAVAAYSAQWVSNAGNLQGGGAANFTSIGPRIDGYQKPNVAAPGVSVVSSINSFTDANYSQVESVTFGDREYPFAPLSGTSMASPVVAGVAAILLEVNPYLSPFQIKQILSESAREDDFTDEIPEEGDPLWGFGKIDTYAAILKALVATGLEDIDQDLTWTIAPNPSSDFIRIDGLVGEISAIQIIDMAGRVHSIHHSVKEISVHCLSPGTYCLRLVVDRRVEQRKFVVR